MLYPKQGLNGLVRVVRDLIGYRLSTVKGANNTTLPSVIQERSNTPKPPHPYVTVDYTNIRKVGYSQRDSYLNDNEDQVDEFDYIVRFTVRVNANNDQDSLGILEEFRSRLFTTRGLSKIREFMPQYGLLNTSDIVFFPSIMTTDYEEASRLTIDFWARSIIVDETIDVITDVIVNGDLYEDYDQVEPPLNVNIIAP